MTLGLWPSEAGRHNNLGRETWTTKIRMREIRVRPPPVQLRARWVAPSRAPWPVVSWVRRSLEPCLAQSLVLQLAQRKSEREEPSRHLLLKGDGRQRLRQPRSGALLLRSAPRRKEKRRLRSRRVRIEGLRVNRGELHHKRGGGSKRAHCEVRRLYARPLGAALQMKCKKRKLPGFYVRGLPTLLFDLSNFGSMGKLHACMSSPATVARSPP